MSRLTLRLMALGAALLLCLVAIVLINESDRRTRDAQFLALCREAHYDAAKCRFFLTDPGE
jgi:hypothetical protein